MLKRNLNSWYNGSVTLQGASLDFCRRKARSVHAFRNPSQLALPDNSIKISTRPGLTRVLSGDNLVWLDPSRRQVRILNMRSWTSRVLNGIAREEIRNVYTSDEIVVFPTTAHTVYVTRLNSPGPLKRFRVINPSVSRAITCRGCTVACAGCLEDSILVYIWNLDSQQGRSFNISYEHLLLSGRQLDRVKAQSAEIGLLLRPDTENITLCMFDICRPTGSSQEGPISPAIVYGCFTFAGERVYNAEYTIDRHDLDTATRLTLSDGMGLRFVQTSHDGLFRLQGNACRAANRSKPVPPLQFDERLNTFTSPICPGSGSPYHCQEGLIVWWNDVFFEPCAKEQTVIYRGTASSPRYETLRLFDIWDPLPDEERYCTDFLLNDRYIIRAYCDAFYIYCYDHTVQLPETEGALDGVGPWKILKMISVC